MKWLAAILRYALKEFNGAALAKALFDAYCKERRAAAGSSRERDKLQLQVCT